jgi:hypothetical protein
MAAMVLRQAQVKLWHLRADAWCCRTIGLRQAIDGMAVFRSMDWFKGKQETMVFTIKYGLMGMNFPSPIH